jgi:adenine-specific DNA methylase
VNLLAYLVEKWANTILEEAREEIGQFYPTETGEGLVGKREVDPGQEGWTPVGYLWSRTIPCQNPTCGATIPLVKQFWLCKKDDKRIAYRPVVDAEAETVDFELLHGEELQAAVDAGFDPGEGTVHRANASCPVCGQVTKAEQVRQLARDGQMDERMVAVVFHHPDETGKKYRLATDADVERYEAAAEYLQQKLDDWPYLDEPLPSENLSPVGTLGFRINRYGMTKWEDLFNLRQKVGFLIFSEKIREAKENVLSDCRTALAASSLTADSNTLNRAVLGYLGIMISRLCDKNARLTPWNPYGEKFDHVFVRQALPIVWDYGEINPFSGVNGDWTSNRDWVLRYLRKNDWDAAASTHTQQSSATDLALKEGSVDAVVTDPPYYDNVPYASLSDFFYVWLKRAIGDEFPDLFSTPVVPKKDEAIMEPERHESSDIAKSAFEDMIGDSFREMHRVLKPGGIAVVVYAHKTTEGWETMLNALVQAGFAVTGSWPVHTERKARLRSAQSAALASSIYMVCRKTEREAMGFWNDVQPVVKRRVEEKLEQFWEADVIRGGDFFISAIGPGMEAYSRYDRVETVSGEAVTVRDLLQYIRRVATDFLVNRLLKDATGGAIDKEAQFYLTYRWTFRDTRVEYDDARRIAAAEGVNLDRLAERESFVKKTTKYIYVHGPEERGEVETIRDMVDAMHAACRRWAAGEKEAVGPLLAEAGLHRSPSFWQFCQAVSECLPDGAKEKQWLEGMLMSKTEFQQTEADGASEGDDEAGQMRLDL